MTSPAVLLGNSKSVKSAQSGPHDGLLRLLERRKSSPSLSPIREHTKEAFDKILPQLLGAGENLILDSCCGTGLSTIKLALRYPSHLVVGIDRSGHRLDKEKLTENQKLPLPKNALLLRAEVGDFWRLTATNNIRISDHYLLYPNPYPKKKHLQKRWHANPAFPALFQLGGAFTMRTNWLVYAEEMRIALDAFGAASVKVSEHRPSDFLTLFEKKYYLSGHTLYQVTARLS